MAEYVMATFSAPVAGREDEFNRWYTGHHLGAMVAVPGVRSAQRFRTSIHGAGEAMPPYLTIYELDARNPEELEAVHQRLRDAKLERGDTADHGKTVNVVFELAGPRLGSGPVGSHRMLVLANAVEGRHEEFNHWYNTVHMAEALSVPGFATAERYRKHRQASGKLAPEYIAIYGLEAQDQAAAQATLKAVFTAGIRQSDTLAPGAVMTIVEVISEKVAAPEAALG